MKWRESKFEYNVCGTRVSTDQNQITVNGQVRTVPAGETIARLLESLAIAPDQVAVELDRRIVKRAAWESTTLASGSSVEIVQFVGGG